MPERLVDRRVRAEREHDRDERAEAEHRREPEAARAREQHEPGERRAAASASRGTRTARARRARRARAGRAARPTSGRPRRASGRPARPSRRSSPAGRASPAATATRGCTDAHRIGARSGRCSRPTRRPRPRTSAYATKNGTAPSARWSWPESGIDASASVASHQRSRSQAQSAAGSRIESGPSRCSVLCATRYGAIANAQPADDRRTERDAERAQPERRHPARDHVQRQSEQVPREHWAEQPLERPEDERERPAGRVDALWRLRLELVRVKPRRAAVQQLVAGEPEVVDGLEVVARRRPAVARLAARAERRTEVRGSRPRDEQRSGEIDGRRGER